jgi:hypothetical protein
MPKTERVSISVVVGEALAIRNRFSCLTIRMDLIALIKNEAGVRHKIAHKASPDDK